MVALEASTHALKTQSLHFFEEPDVIGDKETHTTSPYLKVPCLEAVLVAVR